MNSIQKEKYKQLGKLFKQYLGLTKEQILNEALYTMDFKDRSGRVVSKSDPLPKHAYLEQLAMAMGIELKSISKQDILYAEGDNICILVTGTYKGKTVSDIGEVVVSKLGVKFPFSIALKRGQDRVILKLLGLHGWIYSEEEMREAKEKREKMLLKEGETPVYFDIETDGLFNPSNKKDKRVSKINLLGYIINGKYFYKKDADTIKIIDTFFNDTLPKIQNPVLIGHNIILFDLLVCEWLYGRCRNEETIGLNKNFRVLDTLILCKLLQPQNGKNNSLKHYGKLFNFEKFDMTTTDLVTYNERDLELNKVLFEELDKLVTKTNLPAIELETEFSLGVKDQILNGFCLDIPETLKFQKELEEEILKKGEELSLMMGEVIDYTHYKQMIQRGDLIYKNKEGYAYYTKITRNEVFKPWKFVQANPGSREKVAEFFMNKYGWKPTSWSATGKPKIDKEILPSLTYPEAPEFHKFLVLRHKYARTREWLESFVEETGAVHGSVNTIESTTGRCRHFSPNLANIDRTLRTFWIPREGYILGSVDFQAQETRLLAHFLCPFDKGLLASLFKDTSSDIHAYNKELLDLGNRLAAKSVFYAYMYGAKLPTIVDTIKKFEAKTTLDKIPDIRSFSLNVLNTLKKSYPLEELYKACLLFFDKYGFLVGIDNRHIIPEKTYNGQTLLNSLIQGAGAVLMKKAFTNLVKEVPEIKIVCNVHDEIVFEIKEEDLYLKDKIENCFIKSGDTYNLKVKLGAEAKFGHTWADIH